MEAHTQLEEICLDRETLAFKKIVVTRFADLVYEGKWFTPLRESLSAFTTGDLYDHKEASGFINLFGLSMKVRAMMKQNVEKNTK